MTGNASKIVSFLMEQDDKEKVWDLVEHKQKRSNDANSYFWVLVNELAKNQGLSDTEVHDRYLSENRAYFYIDGVMDWKVSPIHPNAFGLIREFYIDKRGRQQANYYISSNMEVTLCKENGTKCVNRDGTETIGTVFWHIKGTHQMNTAEMSRIINSVVEDAEACGIETLPKKKLEQLLESWGIKK